MEQKSLIVSSSSSPSPPSERETASIATLEEIPDEMELYRGASAVAVTVEQAAILGEDIPDDELEIKPTGEVYASQVRYRNILNRAFKPMGWALRPLGKPRTQDNTIMQEFALYVGGRFVASAWGEQDYFPGNDRMSWATALEAAKSNALTRCCKDLGIASKCWDRKYTDAWLKKNAVKVWVKGKNRPLWRHRDSAPLYNETGLAADSPNKAAGLRQTQPIQPEDESQEPPNSEYDMEEAMPPAQPERVSKILAAFGEFQVKIADLEKFLEQDADRWSDDDLNNLRRIYKALKSGETTWPEVAKVKAELQKSHALA